MQPSQKCPICQRDESSIADVPLKNAIQIECLFCGKYVTSNQFINGYQLEDIAWKLSGYIHARNIEGILPEIFTTTITEILNDPIIPGENDIEVKSKLLLKNIKLKTTYFGEKMFIDFQNTSWAFAKNEVELFSLIDMLIEQGLIAGNKFSSGYRVALTARGFNLDIQHIDSNQVFIATWFDDGQDVNINAMKSAITNAGFDPICIKLVDSEKTIMEQALYEIRMSKLVVVNLTGNRRAVIFELGFAIGLNKPFILVCKHEDMEDVVKEFYPSHYHILAFNNEKELGEQLEDIIKARFPSR